MPLKNDRRLSRPIFSPSRGLPPSGEIKQSQVMSEFNKGNNLRSYLGVAPGVPSSGDLKLTDFYGKAYVPPVHGVGVGYFNGTAAKVSLGECYPGGWHGSGASMVTGWAANGPIAGDFADKFESVVIGDVDIYGTSEWMILIYKPGQHSAGAGKNNMIIRQAGRPTTTIQIFDNRGIRGNWNNSLSNNLAMFSQMTGAAPEGLMGPSVRINYVWNHKGYAFPNLDSQGNQSDVTIEFSSGRREFKK